MRVICIDGDFGEVPSGQQQPIETHIYSVKSEDREYCQVCGKDHIHYELEEIPDVCWDADSFIPIDGPDERHMIYYDESVNFSKVNKT